MAATGMPGFTRLAAMVTSEVAFAITAEHRRGFADLLDTLTPEQLLTPSLSVGWTVHQVGAHLAASLDPQPGQMFGAMVAARGNLHRANMLLAVRRAERSGAGDIARTLRDKAAVHRAPPVIGAGGPMTDVLVHGLDVRFPLGLPPRLPADHARAALEFLTQTRAFGFVRKGLRDGLRFEATDLDYGHGDGALVRGPAASLLLALTGRQAGLADLDGDGVETLRRRLG